MSEQIARFYESAIEDGRVPVGDRLPPIREVASTCSVTRATVQDAYRRLADRGLVEGTVGQSEAGLTSFEALSGGARLFEDRMLTYYNLNLGYNILPGEVRLAGTVRTLKPEVQDLAERRLGEIASKVAEAHGCSAEVDYRRGYPATVNHAEAVGAVRAAATDVVGAENVVETAPQAAAEDFSYFLEKRPGAFVLVGAGNAERGITAPHHSPEFDIDESVLPRGAELLARLALPP